MRRDWPVKIVVASSLVGLGLVAFRAVRLAGVCLAMAAGKGPKREKDGRAVAEKEEC